MGANSDSATGGRDPRAVIEEQIGAATAASKCHPCGCFHSTVTALARTGLGQGELAATVAQARAAFASKQYDCLGCPVCYPAVAANALADAYPQHAGRLDPCPTDAPSERAGWPPLPGDYTVLRYRAPVAVCTLHGDELARRLAGVAPEGLAIVGTLHTENLGIERLIRNVLGNPHLRFLVLCGEDARQEVGHLPGQSLVSLFHNGLDDRGRIRGAKGKRPVIKNVPREHVEAFVEQVELVERIGQSDAASIVAVVREVTGRDPGPLGERVVPPAITPAVAEEPRRLVPDPAGYVVVYPDPAGGRLVLEHYDNDGVLDAVIEGASPGAVYTAAIERGLLSRLDHAAYLGRELARAEQSLRTGERYVQDRAPGELADADLDQDPEPGACGCAGSRCGGEE